MLFYRRQTQAGVFSNFLVALSFTNELRNFPFAACEAGHAWQSEKPESSGLFPVPATIFAGDQKMWSRRADGIELLELNRRPQMRGRG